MTLADPYFLLLLVLFPGMVAWYFFMLRKNFALLQYSSLIGFETGKRSVRLLAFYSLIPLRFIAIALLIVALARPQSSSSRQDVSVEGIDIVMAMDVSGSMLAQDLKPDRLEASKKVAMKFIEGRPNDRIGLVIFSGETFTQSPLTSDHAVIRNLFADIKSGILEDGTALGDGLATAVDRLRNSKAVSKVIILLTDGINNMGALDPRSAGEIAKLFGIRIYAIGVGTYGMAPYPFQTPFGIQYQNVEVKIDEQLLKEIATTTGGKYFRATNNKKLEEIYREIDRLEKSKIDVTVFRKKSEEFFPLVLAAFVLLLLEFLLRNTWLRSLP
ncbi:MAG: VWA domain-containing protein [Bacteroidetes bacterium]|nr:VWA domain-containing protein [Bacteroidota bacterium]